MFNKIKNWIIAIGSAIIAFLFLILGLKNHKIDSLKKENEVKDVVIKQTEISKKAEKEHAQKVTEIQKEASETIEEIGKGEKDYNSIIDDWNNRS